MFAVCYAVFCLLSIGYVFGHIEEQISEKNIILYILESNFVNDILANDVCSRNTTEVEKKIAEVRACSRNIDEDHNTICKVLEINLKECLPLLMNFYEKCVPESSKFWPKYVLDTLRHIVDLFCNTDGAHIFEAGNPCIFKKDHLEEVDCFQKGFKKYNDTSLSVGQQTCLIVEEYKNCLTPYIDARCFGTSNEMYKKLAEVIQCSN